MWHLCCLIIFMLELKSQLNFQSPIHWLPSTVGMHQEEFDFATRTVTSSSLVVFLLWGSHWICSFSISFLYSLPSSSSSSVFLPHIASSSFILWVARFWACLISWKGEKKKRTFKIALHSVLQSFSVHHSTIASLSLVILWWVLHIVGGLDSAEDVLQLLTGQTHHAVLQCCIPTGCWVFKSCLSSSSSPSVSRLSRFLTGSQGPKSNTVFLPVWLYLQQKDRKSMVEGRQLQSYFKFKATYNTLFYK